jgi:hypothetical protein
LKKSEVSVTLEIKILVFWIMTSCGFVGDYKPDASNITLLIDIDYSSKIIDKYLPQPYIILKDQKGKKCKEPSQ